MRITKIALALAALSVPAFSQGLTTIQDTLFKADGTRFNGSITIQWNTFDAANAGLIVQQSSSVSIANGNLQVSLAPNLGATAPANVYRVLYQSDGRNQFTETWTVPVSASPLKIAAVRTGTLAATPGGGVTGAQTPVNEADIVGLLNDLEQRPVKGSGFGTGRVAIVNQNGEVETAVGDSSECVRVDGTSGPCGSSTQFVDAETPGGLVDGSNPTFTLAATPAGSSLQLFRNGLYMTPGFDYALTANLFVFVTGNVPQPSDKLTASYRVDPATLGNVTLPGSTARLVRSAQTLCSATGTNTGTNAYTSLGYCDVPIGFLQPGDRIEVRYTLEHTGTASAFDIQTMFGTSVVTQRHAAIQDSAFAGRVEVGVSDTSAQVGSESYGSVLTLLPSIQTIARPAADKRIDIRVVLSRSGTADRVRLLNYTVLRYPAH